MKQQGFSLIELVTVLLIITVLTTVALRSTVDIGYSARYEQTRDRLDSIKQAIIGNPKRSINGQPDISGFVADMGRLPNNIKELLKQGTQPTYQGKCSDSAYTTQDICITNGEAWLFLGWRGPYLSVSGNPDSPDAYTDGWGRERTDNNYGWIYQVNTPATNDLTLQSLGKNQASGGSDVYDADYPATQPVIKSNDWRADISRGISVSFQKPNGSSSIVIPPVSFCSDPITANNIDRATCEAVPAATWYGGCDKQGYFNKADCESPTLGNSIWYACSDKTSADESSCVAGGAVWYGTVGYNTDTWTKSYIPGSYPQKDICMQVFYRENGVLVKAYSESTSIKENGSYQTNYFKTFNSQPDASGSSISDIPEGINAIGIYEHDGTTCTNTLYPSDRTQPIPVLFVPHRTLPIINW